MKLKVVFDTNIYISAVATRDAHLARFIDKHDLYDTYCSIDILSEVSDKLLSDKFGWNQSDVADLSGSH